MTTITAKLSKAAGVPAGTLTKMNEAVNPWGNGVDGGRAISCAGTSAVFAFAVGVQRGQRDEHPTVGAEWKGPYGLGGGKLYLASSKSTCTSVWAKTGSFFTIGIQVVKPSLSAAECKAAGTAGVNIVITSMEKVVPFTVVPPTSSGNGPPIPATAPPSN